MARFTVVNIDALAKEFANEERELQRADARLIAKRCHSDAEVIELAREAHGILCSYYQTGRTIFEACPELKVVARYGVGVDNVDLAAATEFDIVVTNVPDYCVDEVADHAMALLLGCNRKITRHDRAIRTPEREAPPRVERLRGSTLGLVALGNIGRAVARRAKPFGFEVIAYDPYLDPALAAEVEVPLVTLEEVMSRSDLISVHVPLNDETYGMIGAKELGMMKPTAYIVNTARGGVIDESALYDALKNGSIAGAGVDVWENELEFSHEHPLLEFEHLIATPHVAYYSEASLPTLQRRVGEATADVLLGIRPRHVANPEVLQRVHLQPRPDG